MNSNNTITPVDQDTILLKLSDRELHYLECVYAHKMGEKFKMNTKRIREVIQSSGMEKSTLKEFMDKFDLFNQPPRKEIPLEFLTASFALPIA